MNFDDIIKLVEENPNSAFFFTPSVYKKAQSHLLLNPFEIISINKKDEFDSALNIIQKLVDKGYYGYSLIDYEAGYLFEEKFSDYLNEKDKKLIQFFFFDKNEIKKFKSSKIKFNQTAAEYKLSNFQLNRTEEQFFDDLGKIKNYIKAGDTYQVNYTVKGTFSFSGTYAVFFQKLLFNQSARYSAFINNNDKFVISLSPELFFNISGRKILSRPMKGTTQRGIDHNSDKFSSNELMTGEKNRAENVMIVDLIRNDLGRICEYGSVKVPELFQVEKYESLFQMVSEVEGKLRKGIKLNDILRNIFPCGSVTGAPKIRTMEIIKEIEKEERGIYTGSIGLITPKEIKMNVAIRTISINKNDSNGVMGLGSGIVWDSNPQSEYEEVLLKSKFLTEPLDYFEILETMRFENGVIKFFNDHLTRMEAAADFFLFRFNKKKARKIILSAIAVFDLHLPQKIRISLCKWGQIRMDVSDIKKHPQNVSIIISENSINSDDKFRHFKTTNRKLYDDEYGAFCEKGFYEVIYFNERNELAEGSRTNIFLRKGDHWFTPSLSSGALPGIYRNHFIKNYTKIIESSLSSTDISQADEIILTNAIRGEVKVNKLFINADEYIIYNK
jgi:para-aminobenzoate synthetase / 4-amino-4-deoxychorismate lyase